MAIQKVPLQPFGEGLRFQNGPNVRGQCVRNLGTLNQRFGHPGSTKVADQGSRKAY